MDRDSLGRIIKGSKMTAEERVKQSRALAESWKNRDDYLGPIKNDYPRIFNSWRAIRHTEKGKKAGCSDEWKDYKNFFNDVSPSYESGLVLRRKDTTKPWGKDNFLWLTMKEAGDALSKTLIEYDGKTLNINQWAEVVNQTPTAIKLRYYKYRKGDGDYTIDWVLNGKRINRGKRTPKDLHNTKTSIRAKASKMISSYRTRDRRNGLEECNLTIDWIVENILLKPCVYCGDTHRIGCDRIDNTIGHIIGNVVPCCVECNTARNNYFTFDEMKRIGSVIREIKSERSADIQNGKTDEEIRAEAGRDMEYLRRRCMRRVYKYSLDGEFLDTYESEIEAAEKNGTSAKSVSAAINGMGYRKYYNGHKLKGFLWYNDRTIKEMQTK